MSAMPMDVDPHEEEIEVPSSSTSKGDKKRFEVKKVRYVYIIKISLFFFILKILLAYFIQ